MMAGSRKPPPPPKRATGASQQFQAVRRELTPTPAAGTVMPGSGMRVEAFHQLTEAENTCRDPKAQMGFRACRELLEMVLGRFR